MLVALSPLPAVALLVVIGAVSLVTLRGLRRERVAGDAAATFAAAAASVVAGIGSYAIGTQSGDETAFRNAGAAFFLAFPVVSVCVLNIGSRRRGIRPGSSLAAFLFGAAAVVLIGAWATYSWRGPRGGWRASDILVFAVSAVLIYGAAACLGWWCGRSIKANP